MPRTSLLTATALSLAAFAATAAAQDAPEPITWSGYALENQGPTDRVSVREIAGTEVLTVARTTVMLSGAEFSEGVIEFDIALDDKRGFGGLIWHANGRDTEYFYLRQHKSGLPDAGQYTPIRNGLTGWQLYSDQNAIAPFSFAQEGWNRFRMVVAGDKADIYFNGSPLPVLHIPDLATDQGSGGVGFRASGPDGEISIANLTVRALGDGEGIIGQPKSDRRSPEGTIARWSVSERFAEEAITGAMSLPAELAALDELGPSRSNRLASRI